MSTLDRNQSGDTLVEVLIATAILAAAVVAGLGIMNFGFGVILNSVERTQVQAEMTSQISMIRYARDAYIRADKVPSPGGAKVWDDMVNKPANVNTTDQPKTCNGAARNVAGRKTFYISVNGSGVTQYTNTGLIDAGFSYATAGKGIWVEAVRPASNPNYVDFYVKACWSPAAGNTNEEAKSLVRLYVP